MDKRIFISNSSREIHICKCINLCLLWPDRQTSRQSGQFQTEAHNVDKEQTDRRSDRCQDISNYGVAS